MTTTSSPRRADIGSFYTCRNPQQFQINWRAFYDSAERRTEMVRERWTHNLDVAYDSMSPHQRMDVYFPRQTNETTPVVVFLHGGGFREGDSALYGFLAEPYVERGIIFASVGYRLMPDTHLPETFADAEAAVRFCRASLGTGPLFMAGHSAGAILTAQLGVRCADLLAGAIPISGVYDLRDYGDFFADDSQRFAASPLLHITSPTTRWVVAYGSLENRPNYGVDSRALAESLRQHAAAAEVLELDALDHCGAVEALCDESSPLFQATLNLIQS